MNVLPMVLIVVGVLLLLALTAGLWWQRRQAAVPPGPRTVADLVSKRTAEGAFAAGPPAEPTPAESVPVPGDAALDDERLDDERLDDERLDDEHVDADEPIVAPLAPAIAAPAAATDTDAATVAVPLGGEVPWRRATHMTTEPGGGSAPAAAADPDPRRLPALALLSSPAPAPGSGSPERVSESGRPAMPTLADAVPAVAPERPHWSTPGRGVDRSEFDADPPLVDRPALVALPTADPDVMFDSQPANEPQADETVADEPPAEEPSAAERPAAELYVVAPPATGPDLDQRPAVEPETARPPIVVVPPAGSAAVPPPVAEPAPEPATDRRDPGRVAAEQAAADLALLRTFGSAHLESRPDRAPVVALEGCGRPVPEPAGGAAQPVRFRAVRRDGHALPHADVALLDDRGHESSTGRADAAGTGELRAPHPGSYVLVATAPDHQPGAVALTVGDGPVEADVLLVRSASLVGAVTGEDGPIAGARITLVQDGEVVDSASSAADGRYAVADMAAGEYALSVAAAGCEPHVTLVMIPDEAELVHDVELSPAGVPTG